MAPAAKTRVALLILAAMGVLAGAGAAAMLLRGDGESTEPAPGGLPPAKDPGPVHVHGLGVNPRDGALFIATHTGLWRLGRGASSAARVGDRFQDTMGFAVVGPDRFLGSGHPDLRDDLPPLLGLIASNDSGRTWQPVSLLGDADFHVLRVRKDWVYGFDSANERLLLSRDAGNTWSERSHPEPLVDLAIAPGNPRRLVASGAERLYRSRDAGASWERAGGAPSLLAWPDENRLYAVDAAGDVRVSRDTGRRWRARGSIGGQPAAFYARRGELYAALHDGTVKRSLDGGTTWSVRSTA